VNIYGSVYESVFDLGVYGAIAVVPLRRVVRETAMRFGGGGNEKEALEKWAGVYSYRRGVAVVKW